MNLSERSSRVIRGAVGWQPMQISRLGRAHEREAAAQIGAGADLEADIQARIAAAFQAGVAQGLQQAHAQTQERERQHGLSAQQRWDSLLAGLAGGIGEVESAMADRLLDLTTLLAATVACREITLSRDRIAPVLAESLKLIAGACRHLEVTAHPSDCAAIETWLQPRCATGTTLSIRPDPGVMPGGCLLRADDSLLDATLQTRIRRTFAAVGLAAGQADAVLSRVTAPAPVDCADDGSEGGADAILAPPAPPAGPAE